MKKMKVTIEDLEQYRNAVREYCWILGYDKNNNFIKNIRVSIGTDEYCHCPISTIIKLVKQNNFHHFVQVHNHVYDDNKIYWSMADRNTIFRLSRESKKAGVIFYDALIFNTNNLIFSFRNDYKIDNDIEYGDL